MGYFELFGLVSSYRECADGRVAHHLFGTVEEDCSKLTVGIVALVGDGGGDGEEVIGMNGAAAVLCRDGDCTVQLEYAGKMGRAFTLASVTISSLGPMGVRKLRDELVESHTATMS